MDYKKIIEAINKLVSKSNIYNFIVVFLIGVLLVIVTNYFKSTTNTMQPVVEPQKLASDLSQSEIVSYQQNIKNQLKSILGNMQGVGKVEVMITFESGEELVPAVNINDGNSTTKEKDIGGGERNINQESKGSQVVMSTKGGNTEPLILKKKFPKVAGVMIISQGAQDKQVQLSITKAVSVLFDIPNSKVNVYPMER